MELSTTNKTSMLKSVCFRYCLFSMAGLQLPGSIWLLEGKTILTLQEQEGVKFLIVS